MTKTKSHIPKIRFKEFSGEWEEKKLGEVLTIGSGKDYKHLENGKYPVYGTGGYMLSVGDYLYDGESVCIGRKGTIDKPRFLTGKFWTVDTLFYTHSFIESLPKYVFYIFNTINWQEYNEASGVPSLSKNTLNNIKINLPSLPEQQKIASFISSVDEKIEKMKEKKKNLEEYKKGVMQKIFSQEIRFKDENGEEFGEWEEKKLGEIGDIYQPQTISQTDLTKDGFFVYGANGIIGKYHTYNHEFEQIAVTCRGNTCGTINYTFPKSWITGNAMVINIDNNKNINKKYLYFYLINDNLNYLITGSGQPQITGSIKSHKVNLPTLKEQEKIADFLSGIDEKIEKVSDELGKMEEFKKGLLQGMFV